MDADQREAADPPRDAERRADGAIEALNNAYPDDKMFEEGDDEEGRSQNLPLHNATLKSAVDGVVEKLLDANPEASRVANAVGYLPIHYAAEKKCTPACMKMLTNVHADGARSKNSDQLVPLQLAAAYQADDEVVGELLRVYPEATRLKSEEGKSPRASRSSAPRPTVSSTSSSSPSPRPRRRRMSSARSCCTTPRRSRRPTRRCARC